MPGGGGKTRPGASAPTPWRPGKQLRRIEQRMLANAAVGEITGEVLDEPPDLDTMRSWGTARTVRAEVIRHLLVSEEWPLHPAGLYLSGLRVAGRLDLSDTTVRAPLWLEDCLADLLVIDRATVPQLVLHRCHFDGMSGEGAAIRGACILDGSTLTGPLVLLDAEVGGIKAVGTTFAGSDPANKAVFADRARIRAGVHLRGARATAAVRFAGADIGGQFVLRGMTITQSDEDGYSLRIDECRVGNLAVLDRGFRTVGAVNLAGADLASLECDEAVVGGTDRDGDAVVADRLIVRRSAFFRNFVAAGTVRLPHAAIDGPMECDNSTFAGAGVAIMANQITVNGTLRLVGASFPNGAMHVTGGVIDGEFACRDVTFGGRDGNGLSLMAQAATVRDSVYLDGSFSAVGGVWLAAANIGGTLALDGARFGEAIAFAAPGAAVGHELRWLPRGPVVGNVDLDRVTARRLVDDWSRPNADWPSAGRLRLTGFTYDSFGGPHQATARQRIDWLRLQHGPGRNATFASQSYEQLTRVYRAAGQEADARTTAIAARNDLRKYGSLTRTHRVTNWVLDKSIKHGYQPFRAVLLLAAVYVAVVAAFAVAQHRDGAMVATKPPAGTAPVARDCSAAYPCFYPAGYALDLVVPIVDVHQAEYWRPDGSRPWGWAYVAGTWVATGAGWALSTLAVVAYTSLVRKE